MLKSKTVKKKSAPGPLLQHKTAKKKASARPAGHRKSGNGWFEEGFEVAFASVVASQRALALLLAGPPSPRPSRKGRTFTPSRVLVSPALAEKPPSNHPRASAVAECSPSSIRRCSTGRCGDGTRWRRASSGTPILRSTGSAAPTLAESLAFPLVSHRRKVRARQLPRNATPMTSEESRETSGPQQTPTLDAVEALANDT